MALPKMLRDQASFIASVGVSVVVPVHNEGAALRVFLPRLIAELRGWPAPHSWEIVVVDDASRDGTSRLLAEEFPNITAIRHESRRGSGAARKSGSRSAQGEWVVWIDGDDTYCETDIRRLLEVSDGLDQVIGARRTENGSWPRLRWATKRAIFLVAAATMRTPIPDLNSGLRAIRRERLLEWIDELPDGFSCTSTSTLAALRCGHRLAYLPVEYRSRTKGSQSKFHPLWDTLRMMKVVWHYGCAARGRRSSFTKHKTSTPRAGPEDAS